MLVATLPGMMDTKPGETFRALYSVCAFLPIPCVLISPRKPLPSFVEVEVSHSFWGHCCCPISPRTLRSTSMRFHRQQKRRGEAAAVHHPHQFWKYIDVMSWSLMFIASKKGGAIYFWLRSRVCARRLYGGRKPVCNHSCCHASRSTYQVPYETINTGSARPTVRSPHRGMELFGETVTIASKIVEV